MIRRPTLVVLVCAAALTLTGCATGPTTKAELCGAFDELGTRLYKANGIFDNAIFRQAGTLSSVAGRYEGSNLSQDESALKSISKSDSTSGSELMSATRQTAAVCGHPLGANALLGS